MAALAVAALRVYYCFEVQVYTTDLNRNLGYGYAFSDYGMELYDLTPYDLSPWPVQYLWPNHHYPYPTTTLLFFAALASISTSAWFGKLILTLLEAVNALLAWRISGDRWTALLYWLNPISIWFASREGQFEPWVAFWSLLAIYALRKNKPWAYGAWGLAVQAKVFPIVLAPLFLSQLAWREPRRLAAQIAWGLASGIPSIYAALTSPYLQRFLSPGYIPYYNPIAWNISDPALYPFFPYWLVVAHFITGAAFVIAGLIGMAKTRARWDFIAPLMVLIWIKANVLGQWWYVMLVPGFCLCIEDTTWRRRMLMLAILLGIRSLYSIVIGPIGYLNPPEATYILEETFNGF